MTKNDLSQIRGIVQEETRKIVQEETRKIVQEEIEPLKKDISIIKRDVKKIKIDVKAHASYFDKEQLELKDRVKTTERQLGITPLF